MDVVQTIIKEGKIMNVVLNQKSFSYDVHSLVKAFFPQEDVVLFESLEDMDKDCHEKDEKFLLVDVAINDGTDKATTSINSTNEKEDNSSIKDTEFILASGELRLKFGEIEAREVYISKSRPEIKNILKLAIYDLLCKSLNTSLPWGTLTGIRPTKIPMKMINEGCSDDKIRNYLKEVYACSEEKISLATDIARREEKLLKGVDTKGFSLYVGIPFCPTTCLYCSFTSYPITIWKKKVREYLDTLKKELKYVAETFAGQRLDSVYVGGGTPTTLEAEELSELLTYINEIFDMSKVRELTVEAGRPDSITIEKLKTLKKCGVTRISINPQTMNDETLKIIGRRHDVNQVIEAFNMAREAGFDNINMDIILGLPGERIDDVGNTLNEIKKLGPDSLTVHSMAIKRAAGMHKFLEEHEEIETVNTPEMMEEAIAFSKDMGLDPYYLYRQKNMTGNLENIGFARPGKYGVYNILIMEEVQSIVACGAGTVTKRVYTDGRIERCDNVKDVGLYIEKIDEMIERKRQLFAD